MTDGEYGVTLSRRRLLGGLGTAAVTMAAGAAALPRSSVNGWDITTDVLVAGSGAAGVSAAIEARRSGASVLLVESLPRFGGSSAMSAGVVYAGGGTALQKVLNVEDSVEQMARFIGTAGGRHAPLDKIQLYCEESAAHFDWLAAQGVPYSTRLAPVPGLPRGDESLYFSGNEFAWPARELAAPAPRGHVPGVTGSNGGRRMMEALLSTLGELGVSMRAGVAGERLVVESDGRIAGMQLSFDAERLFVRARRGVVLACGGFIHNRAMVNHYAPELYDCSVPWGNAGDLGRGINMGIAVGAATQRMHQGYASLPLYPPLNVLSGIVVNAMGQRFISEESYHGVLGDAVAYGQGGRAWLITDQRGSYAQHQDNFLPVARGNTIGDLAAKLQFPRGALQHNVAYFNRHAANGRDPMFHKSGAFLRPVQEPPYTAWDLSVDKAFCPAHTLGGLQTTDLGQVMNSFGDEIPGLYAAGRTTAGLPSAPYIAGGLSLGDCTFFGRRAGRAAATV